jgi:integrase
LVAKFPHSSRKAETTLTLNITARRIEKVRADVMRTKVPVILHDTVAPGLWLRVGPSRASWIIITRAGGKDASGRRFPQRKHVLGDAREMSPDAAREAAARAKAAATEGRDPTAERKHRIQALAQGRQDSELEARARRRAIEAILDPASNGRQERLDFSALAAATLDECRQAYRIHNESSAGERHRAEADRHIAAALSEMGVSDRQPAEITFAHIDGLLRLHRGRPANARHRVGAVGRLLRWLISKRALAIDITTGTAVPPPPPPRSSYPDADAVRELWNGAERLSPARRDFLRMMLLVPLRRGEMANLTVGDIQRDGQRLQIALKAANTKNRRAFIVPLVGKAREIVERLLEGRRDGREYLFRLTDTGRAFVAWKALGKDIERVCGRRLAWHDLRRLVVSEAGEHEIGTFAELDELLNHSASTTKLGAARHYHHGANQRARSRVLSEWDKIIEYTVEHGHWLRHSLEENADVVPIGGAR